jgi:hypothetical protein
LSSDLRLGLPRGPSVLDYVDNAIKDDITIERNEKVFLNACKDTGLAVNI